jgi:hypothetical protein
MNNYWDIDVSLIQGLMVGIEFPPLMEIDEDVTFCCALDLGIIRVVFVRWKGQDF